MSVYRARQQAARLVRELGIVRPPVGVRKIAKNLGLEILCTDLDDDVSGMLITKAGRSYIVVRKADHAHRQNFTIAHEIAHFYLGHQHEPGDHVHVDRGNFISQRGARAAAGVDLKEIEANQFAACLLMPEILLKPMAESLGAPDLYDHVVASLAEQFAVSQQAMTIRLTTLGLL